MTIQILGPGCANCHNLEKNAREAVATLGLDASIEKITDINEIVEMGVMRTPGFAVDGKVIKFGKVFSAEEITGELAAYKD